MKSSLLLLLAILAVIGCGRSPMTPETPTSAGTLHERVQGSWAWRKSVAWDGPNGIGVTTPESCGCSRTIVFGNSYIGYRNNTLVDSTSYSIRRGMSDDALAHGDTATYLVIGSARYSPPWIRIVNDTLVIDASYIDGPTEYYKRREE